MAMQANPVWLATKPKGKFRTLEADLQVDVVVIGGGITGLTAAHALVKAGKSVAVLEQHEIAGGETGHTTAHLTLALDSGLPTLVQNFGEDGARALWQAGEEAIRHIEAQGIDCNFERVPAYFFAASAADEGRVKEELELAIRLGFDGRLVHDALYPPMRHAAMALPNQAQFHPTRYLMVLAKLIDGGDSHVFEHAHVTQVHHGEPVRVEANGFVVTADHVVYATHQPIHDKLFVAKLAAYQTYAVGLKIASGTFPHALAWDTMEPYHYWRQLACEGHDLLIVGGEDHRTGQEDDTHARFQALLDYVAEALHGVPFEPVYRWSGQVLSPMDGAPFIGRLASHANAYVGTGYNGNGMTMGTMAGLVIADLIQGKGHPLAGIVDPNRFRVAAGGVTFLQENMAFPTYLVGDRLNPKDCPAIAQIENGQGCLVDIDGEMVAASKDEDGNVQAVSATCTHMGCLVHWNGAEKTWDCPCHGSRFMPDGKVVCGPAREGLPPARATLKASAKRPGS